MEETIHMNFQMKPEVSLSKADFVTNRTFPFNPADAEAAMKDYDVNPAEWDDEGKPKDGDTQLKRMW